MPDEELARTAPRAQSRPDAGLPVSANPTNWFIAVGVVVALVGGWFAMGQSGRPLQDGDYGCSAGPPAIGGGPGATVEGGEVVDVWDFDMRAGRKVSLRWRDAERTSPTEFTVTSAVPMLRRRTQTYVCTHD